MTDSNYLTKLRAEVEANGGKPPGEQRFYRSTGLSREDLWAAGYASYGEACKAVGAEPNRLQRRYTDDELLGPLALLARQVGKFPSKGAVEVQRKRDSSFPSWDSFSHRAARGPEPSLRAALVEWCGNKPDFADVAALIVDLHLKPTLRRGSRQVVNGFVYLMRYGAGGTIFKIGLTDNVQRRHAQINAMAPQDVRIVHSISTDDPEGIERYWFARFAPKRVDGKQELFRLNQDDVAAFRSRKYM